MKKHFSTELAYALGLIFIALSVALMQRANFGLSMIVAPAYILHLKISEFLPFFSFGMAEYTLQAGILLLLSAILRKFKISYIFSFVTAFIYGILLDRIIELVALLPYDSFAAHIIYYILGLVICALGVALMFRTYIPPEAYDLFVMEFSGHFSLNISKVKTVYDCTSCLVALILSFSFFGFGHFRGISYGTVITALLNGTIIGIFSRFLNKKFEFYDALPLRKYFTK